MPLRDHFRPPLDNLRHWEGLHGGWPMMIVANLRRHLPRRYYAEPHVHRGASAEIDVATFESDDAGMTAVGDPNGHGSTATALWAPPQPALSVVTDLPTQGSYEVRVYDEKRRSRLVAAVELISPSNKDRPEHRFDFVAKCAAYLREQVSVVMVDLVTTRTQNLYAELLEHIGQPVPALNPTSPLYAVACRFTRRGHDWLLEAWPETLHLGHALPTMPLWLTDTLAVPLELEESYEQSCTILGIP